MTSESASEDHANLVLQADASREAICSTLSDTSPLMKIPKILKFAIAHWLQMHIRCIRLIANDDDKLLPTTRATLRARHIWRVLGVWAGVASAGAARLLLQSCA
jgi:hypothetical protein